MMSKLYKGVHLQAKQQVKMFQWKTMPMSPLKMPLKSQKFPRLGK